MGSREEVKGKGALLLAWFAAPAGSGVLAIQSSEEGMSVTQMQGFLAEGPRVVVRIQEVLHRHL